MVVRQSTLLGKARREAPLEADTISHKLLTRAAYIQQLASGIFSFLPLGWRVHQRLEEIIRQEMRALGAQEVFLPALQPAALWAESGRLTTIDPPLFRVQDRHKKELVLASTHEEVITDLARTSVDSYKDLPLSVFQVQTKFRNEMRATGGLLRVREFSMKDLYSFHANQKDLQTFYEQVKQAYLRIFQRCDLKARAVVAHSGTIGGSVSHEFSTEAATGEDKVLVCTNCEFAANTEMLKSEQLKSCPQCQHPLTIQSCIENGHIFQLGTKYSETMGALFTDATGQKQPIIMGCYGIGVGRLLASIVETHHDDKGIIWPASVSPLAMHVVPLHPNVFAAAQKVAEELGNRAGDILLDDRAVSAGQKLAEADLIGIHQRLVISPRTEAEQAVEVKRRSDDAVAIIKKDEFFKQWRVASHEIN